MKNVKNKLSYTLYFVLVAVLSSCGTEDKENIEQEKDEREMYISDPKFKADLQILKVRNCEYVLWHNSYGSDMEHYEGCNNAEHCN